MTPEDRSAHAMAFEEVLGSELEGKDGEVIRTKLCALSVYWQ